MLVCWSVDHFDLGLKYQQLVKNLQWNIVADIWYPEDESYLHFNLWKNKVKNVNKVTISMSVLYNVSAAQSPSHTSDSKLPYKMLTKPLRAV